MLTGRDLIAAEKKFLQSFTFENYAKLMYSANKVPEANDDTNAFFRRWIIIVFPKVFTPGVNADPYILEKLTTETELSGLLNLALAGLKRLLEKGEFSSSKTTEEVKEDYIRKSSPIAAFLMDCAETDSDAFIEKKALYGVFAEYCRCLTLPSVNQDTFFKNLPKHVAVTDYKPTVEGKRCTTFSARAVEADDKDSKTVKTLAMCWWFNKRAFSLSRDWQTCAHDLILQYNNSNRDPHQLGLPSFLDPTVQPFCPLEWSLLGWIQGDHVLLPEDYGELNRFETHTLLLEPRFHRTD